jgi:uncharacterized protein (DUF1778 family)
MKKIFLSKRDSKIFFEAVFNPFKPNEKLKEAKIKYDEFKKKGG